MTYQNHGSFRFGGTDMYQKYGIRILDTGMPDDAFIPAIRSRKVLVPGRHGEYDFGAKYYDERTLTLNCITDRKLGGLSLRSYAREIAYVLSKKSEIRLWNEPDKYYVGRIYDAAQLNQLRDLANAFKLVFICEPFAYGKTVYEFFNGNKFIPNYNGTFPTPAYIEIVNNSNVPIKNIRISQINRRESY